MKKITILGSGLGGAVVFCGVFSLQWFILGIRPNILSYTLPFTMGYAVGIIIYRLKLKWEAEASRRESERLRAVRELSGAMCHEMGQPLQILMGNLDILRLDLPQEDPHHRILGCMEREIFRIKEISHQLEHLQKYKTKPYLGGRIIDINPSLGESHGN